MTSIKNELIGKRIKKARNIANISQETLARRLFISRTCLSNYEANRRSIPIPTLFRISEALEVPMDYLLGKSGIPKSLLQINDNFSELENHLTDEGHLDLSKDSTLIKIMIIEYYLFIKEKSSSLFDEMQE